MEEWRKKVIADGFVCVDCHEPVAKDDQKNSILRLIRHYLKFFFSVFFGDRLNTLE